MDYLLPGFISLSRIIVSPISAHHPHLAFPISHLPPYYHQKTTIHSHRKHPFTQTKCIYSCRKKPIRTSQAGTGRPSRNSPRRTACWEMILNGKSSLLLAISSFSFFFSIFKTLFSWIPSEIGRSFLDADILFSLFPIPFPVVRWSILDIPIWLVSSRVYNLTSPPLTPP
jgi:hypothetical protein